ncbi:MAG: glycoside hydrolase family 43 protein [Saccharofermentanales bacterium]|jgi:xylan 1,4-beta-xylosidase
MIKNPILPGAHGDPSIVRDGDDFYLITSTFEWFPGILLYHSRDLQNWELIDCVLKTKEYLDLTGIKPSLGVWAPCLSFDPSERRFYLMYSNVHSRNKFFFDVDNYLIWTDDIRGGKWSKPIYINSSGFDPSLFHDDDGRKWIVNKDRDFRPQNVDKRAIIVQEFDFSQNKLIGEPIVISRGATERRFVEGPHIFKHKGYYYLITAEGGTGYAHCVALSRSSNVTGPYEPYPHNPIITSNPNNIIGTEQVPFMLPEHYNPDVTLQKAGHGALVETQSSEWYMVHHCGRPIMPQKRCVLGRETAIQKMEWTPDGWLRMADGSNIAKPSTPKPNLPVASRPPADLFCDFDEPSISLHFNTPRNEITPEWADISSRKGYLRLRGQESLTSNYYVSLLARRLTAFKARVTTLLDFHPGHYRHAAGLTCYYDTESHYAVFKTYDEVQDTDIISIYGYINSELIETDVQVNVPKGAQVYLRAEIDHAELQFSYSLDNLNYQKIGQVLDMSALSDEASKCGTFTGAFIGMYAQDTHTKSKWADFDWFNYEPLDPED